MQSECRDQHGPNGLRGQKDAELVDKTVAPKTEPAYRRIARILGDRIIMGEYEPGDRLPPEPQLAAEFGVSVMTLRRSVRMLADRSLVSAEQGRGTFVRSLDLGRAVFGLHQWAEQVAHDSVQVKLLQASSQPATEKVARVLGCRPGDRTLFLRRLLTRQGEPIMYHREHLVYDPRRPLVEAELRVTSLEGILQSASGAGIAGGRLKVMAIGLNDEEAHLLRDAPGGPAFCLEHVFTDAQSRAVSWGWFLCRADLFWLEAIVGAGSLPREGVEWASSSH